MQLTIGIFGNIDFIKKLGKHGTINDIMIYNHASSDGVFTFVSPVSSEKIQPLLQVINMIDVPVIVSEEITKELAEQLMVIDAFGFEKGFIISSSEDLRKLIKGTCIEKFEWLADEKQLREKIMNVVIEYQKNIWAPIDNYFDVKSVGTVVLTIIKGGTVKKHDKLIVQPLAKEVLIKGIQSQDRDIEEASSGMRAGLNLKGIEAEELKRGYVICNNGKVSKAIEIEFMKSRFSKNNPEGSQVFLSVGLQVLPGRFENNKITLENSVVYQPGMKCMIASTKQVMPRIIGSGRIK